MPGYLDTYGAAEQHRGRWIKRTLLPVVIVAVVGAGAYFYFRTWSQEQTMKHFLAALENKDFQGAYSMWCPAEHPCKYNPFDKFTQDWGPTTPYSHGAAAKVDNVDYCGEGVVFNISYPNAEPLVLWVEKSTNIISFAPSGWERCPGRHWEFGRFFKSLSKS
jgi:hypothetical protein